MKFGPGEGLARKRPRGSGHCPADRAVKHPHLPGKDFRMLRPRSLALALTTAGTLAVSAPAADAVTNTTLTFGGGTVHAVYNDVSTDGCQVYTGATFGEADELPTTDGSTVFDIRKDGLAPDIAVAMDDSAGGAADCRGFDGTSLGRPLSFATA